MRKLVLSLVAMFLMAGLVIAASGVVTKVDGNNITIKEGDKEEVYEATKDTKFSMSGKDGKKDSDLETFSKIAGKAKKGVKVEFEASGKKLTELSWKAGKAK